MSPQIIEVRRRSDQGATQPFLCKADNDVFYWVKGARSGNEALCAEWIAARLGRLLGLPIPDYAQVIVPTDLIEDSVMVDISDLGSGIRFGSRNVANSQEYDPTKLAQTNEILKRRVLVFDAWIRNTDRTLSPQLGSSGNPNLLWVTQERRLFVIDHDHAFLPDDLFRPSDYNRHAFASERANITPDFKNEIIAEIRTAMQSIVAIMAEIPVDWQYLDNPANPIRLTTDTVRGILEMPLRDSTHFWNMIGGTQ